MNWNHFKPHVARTSCIVKIINFKRNSSGRTRIYEYSPALSPIIALAMVLYVTPLYTKRLHHVHIQKRGTCNITGLNNIVLLKFFIVFNNIVQHCYTWLRDIQAQQYCLILVTTTNDIGSISMFKHVMNNLGANCAFLPMYSITLYYLHKIT